MQTKVANSYTFSREFLDSAPRMRARDLRDRLGVPPEPFELIVHGTANDFEPSNPPIIEQDGELWLTEAQCYAVLSRPAFDGRFDKQSSQAGRSALLESIQAFVDERRKPGSQLSTVVDGKIAYERRMPGSAELFREVSGENVASEVGAIHMVLVSAHDPDSRNRPSKPTAEALSWIRDSFSLAHAKHMPSKLAVVSGGRSPRTRR